MEERKLSRKKVKRILKRIKEISKLNDIEEEPE